MLGDINPTSSPAGHRPRPRSRVVLHFGWIDCRVKTGHSSDLAPIKPHLPEPMIELWPFVRASSGGGASVWERWGWCSKIDSWVGSDLQFSLALLKIQCIHDDSCQFEGRHPSRSLQARSVARRSLPAELSLYGAYRARHSGIKHDLICQRKAVYCSIHSDPPLLRGLVLWRWVGPWSRRERHGATECCCSSRTRLLPGRSFRQPRGYAVDGGRRARRSTRGGSASGVVGGAG